MEPMCRLQLIIGKFLAKQCHVASVVVVVFVVSAPEGKNM